MGQWGPEIPEPENAPSRTQRLAMWSWRHRRPLTPPVTLLGLHLATRSGHLFAPADWPFAGLVVGGAAGIAAARLERPEERAYVGLVGGAAAAWTAAAWAIGPSEPHLVAGLAVGGTLAAIPWWVHMRVRSRVTVNGPTVGDLVEQHGLGRAAALAVPVLWSRWRRWLPAAREFRRMQRDWEWAAWEPSLRGTELVSAYFSDHAVTLSIKLEPTRTWRVVEAAKESIESVFETSRHGVVTVEPGATTRLCVARLIEDSPLDEDQVWPGPTSADFKDPIVLGLREADLSPVEIRLLDGHVLVAGATGSGKGGVLSLLMGCLAACSNVRIWAGDPARSELTPWRAVCDRLERTTAGIRRMLADAMAEVERREQLLEDNGLRNWDERLGPWIAVVVDELAQLDQTALGEAARLAQRCRKAGMRLVFATQRPSAKALASRDQAGTELRSQFNYRIVLHVAEPGDTRVILGEGRSYWRAEELPMGGWFLILGPGHERPRRARAYRLSDEVVSATAERYALARPRSDADPAVGEGSASRVVPLVSGPSIPPAMPAPPELRVVGGRPEDPLDRLREALARAGEHGARVGALTREIGLSDSQTYHYLGVLKELCEVEVVGRARYRLADSSRWSVDQEVTR